MKHQVLSVRINISRISEEAGQVAADQSLIIPRGLEKGNGYIRSGDVAAFCLAVSIKYICKGRKAGSNPSPPKE